MIDLHCHLLPGVDDGSKSVEQSVAVLATMVSEGVTDVVLTPHLDASRILESPPPEHDEAMAALTSQAPAGIRLHRGAEVMVDRGLTPRAIATRRITLAGSRYVLVEFTRQVAGRSTGAALTQMVKDGLTPLVAQPERYSVCSVEIVTWWKEIGAIMQVDANTLFLPTSGGNRARDLVASGLEAEAGLLMQANPAAILADQQVDSVPPAKVKVSLLTRLKGWVREVQE